jgi:RES domain-containing protein
MKVYRIALTQYNDTSGEGAKIYGGRWNLPRSPAIYAGSSISSSLLERLTIDPELLSSERYIRYAVMEINIPVELLVTPDLLNLPIDWNHIPSVKALQAYGTDLLKFRIACFAVPSVVDPSSLNYVINPLSDKIHLLEFKTYPLELDQRIFK